MEVRLFFLWSNPGLSARERVKTRTCINSVLLLTALSSSEPAKLFWCRSNRQSHDKQGDWSFRLVRRCHERATPESQLDDQSNLSTIGLTTWHLLVSTPGIACCMQSNELSHQALHLCSTGLDQQASSCWLSDQSSDSVLSRSRIA